ncbi:MAG TPA: hypothetical protein VMV57_09275 [Terracidiphilus sp.]|nr:hypothetical protein [Terracidiphilus sp.]
MRLKLRCTALLALALLSLPAFAAIQARPGTVNYVEGRAYLQGMLIRNRDVGTDSLNPGSILSTRNGKAEILLTPGVFLRVGSHSTVRMISPDITHTQVQLLRGRAGVEVDEIHPENDLQILDGGVSTRLLKTGYYEFDTHPAMARVFSGEASVQEIAGRSTTVKGHHQIRLEPGVASRSVGFHIQDAQNDLYNWSRLRSKYLAENSRQIAREYAGASGYYPGWYWDPYAWDYAYLAPGPFWSPFSWGYSPPMWGGFYGGYGWGGDFDGDGGGFRGGGGGFRGGGARH